jgi:hypothetical protein
MNWTNGIDFAITVCGKNGVITYMNDKSIKTFENDGGAKLIGTNVLDCHPEPSRTQLSGMLETEKKNVYTIEKNGKKKLIYQTPYYENDEYKGFVELSLEIPEVMENFVRG